MDLMSPIALFSDYIDDFWFVDRAIFHPGIRTPGSVRRNTTEPLTDSPLYLTA